MAIRRVRLDPDLIFRLRQMKRASSKTPLRRDSTRRGSAMVEVAVCFPVFLLILLGIIEFGRAMSVNQLLNSAARIGCRAAILDGSTNTSVTGLVTSHVTSTLGCSAANITVELNVTDGNTGTVLADVSAATTGDVIQLDVRVPFSAVSWSVQNVIGDKPIRGECAMQHE